MSDNNAPLPWKHIYKTLVQYAPLWGGAVVLFTGFGMASALFSRDYWSASQPLVLRDEATGSVERLGRFGSQTQMKAAQETILEMATNFDVVRSALEQVGPVDGHPDPTWPTADDVNAVAKKRVTVRAAQGSELGSTEVIYLSVQATSPERSRQFCNAVYESLTERLRTVRQLRADSIMAELVQARDLAREKLDHAAGRLREIEVAFGSDLGELRNLSETFGDGANRRLLDETQRELQAAELELEQLEALHSLLVGGREDPNRLLVSGGELLSTQPSLLKMKDGLIEAQLQQSQLSGRYTSLHPRLRAAIETEREIRQQIRVESAVVVEAMQPTLQLGRDKVARLRKKQEQLNARLTKVAGVRTEYAGLAAEVKHRTQLLEQAETALTEAQATRAAALSVNLLAQVGPPVVSDSPVGASGSLLTLGSATAGLMFGLGAVFLIAPGPNQTGRGRRWSDLIGGRRATDQTPAGTTPVPGGRGYDRRAASRAAAPTAQPPQTVLPANAPPPTPAAWGSLMPATAAAAAASSPATAASPDAAASPETTSPVAAATVEMEKVEPSQVAPVVSGEPLPSGPAVVTDDAPLPIETAESTASEPEAVDFEATDAEASDQSAADPETSQTADGAWAATVFSPDPLNQSNQPESQAEELDHGSEPVERDAPAQHDAPAQQSEPLQQSEPALQPIVYRDVYDDEEEDEQENPFAEPSDVGQTAMMSFSQLSQQLGAHPSDFPGDRRKQPRDE